MTAGQPEAPQITRATVKKAEVRAAASKEKRRFFKGTRNILDRRKSENAIGKERKKAENQDLEERRVTANKAERWHLLEKVKWHAEFQVLATVKSARKMEATRYIKWYQDQHDGEIPKSEQIRDGLAGKDADYIKHRASLSKREAHAEQYAAFKDLRNRFAKEAPQRAVIEALTNATPEASQQIVDIINRASSQKDHTLTPEEQATVARLLNIDGNSSEPKLPEKLKKGMESLAKKAAKDRQILADQRTGVEKMLRGIQKWMYDHHLKGPAKFLEGVMYVSEKYTAFVGIPMLAVGGASILAAHLAFPPLIAIESAIAVPAAIFSGGTAAASLLSIPKMLMRMGNYTRGLVRTTSESASHNGEVNYKSKLSDEIRQAKGVGKVLAPVGHVVEGKSRKVHSLQERAQEHMHSVKREVMHASYKGADNQSHRLLKDDGSFADNLDFGNDAVVSALIGMEARIRAAQQFDEAHQQTTDSPARHAWKIDATYGTNGEQRIDEGKLHGIAEAIHQQVQNRPEYQAKLDAAIVRREDVLNGQLANDARVELAIIKKRMVVQTLIKGGALPLMTTGIGTFFLTLHRTGNVAQAVQSAFSLQAYWATWTGRFTRGFSAGRQLLNSVGIPVGTPTGGENIFYASHAGPIIDKGSPAQSTIPHPGQVQSSIDSGTHPQAPSSAEQTGYATGQEVNQSLPNGEGGLTAGQVQWQLDHPGQPLPTAANGFVGEPPFSVQQANANFPGATPEQPDSSTLIGRLNFDQQHGIPFGHSPQVGNQPPVNIQQANANFPGTTPEPPGGPLLPGHLSYDQQMGIPYGHGASVENQPPLSVQQANANFPGATPDQPDSSTLIGRLSFDQQHGIPFGHQPNINASEVQSTQGYGLPNSQPAGFDESTVASHLLASQGGPSIPGGSHLPISEVQSTQGYAGLPTHPAIPSGSGTTSTGGAGGDIMTQPGGVMHHQAPTVTSPDASAGHGPSGVESQHDWLAHYNSGNPHEIVHDNGTPYPDGKELELTARMVNGHIEVHIPPGLEPPNQGAFMINVSNGNGGFTHLIVETDSHGVLSLDPNSTATIHAIGDHGQIVNISEGELARALVDPSKLHQFPQNGWITTDNSYAHSQVFAFQGNIQAGTVEVHNGVVTFHDYATIHATGTPPHGVTLNHAAPTGPEGGNPFAGLKIDPKFDVPSGDAVVVGTNGQEYLVSFAGGQLHQIGVISQEGGQWVIHPMDASGKIDHNHEYIIKGSIDGTKAIPPDWNDPKNLTTVKGTGGPTPSQNTTDGLQQAKLEAASIVRLIENPKVWAPILGSTFALGAATGFIQERANSARVTRLARLGLGMAGVGGTASSILWGVDAAIAGVGVAGAAAAGATPLAFIPGYFVGRALGRIGQGARTPGGAGVIPASTPPPASAPPPATPMPAIAATSPAAAPAPGPGPTGAAPGAAPTPAASGGAPAGGAPAGPTTPPTPGPGGGPILPVSAFATTSVPTRATGASLNAAQKGLNRARNIGGLGDKTDAHKFFDDVANGINLQGVTAGNGRQKLEDQLAAEGFVERDFARVEGVALRMSGKKNIHDIAPDDYRKALQQVRTEKQLPSYDIGQLKELAGVLGVDPSLKLEDLIEKDAEVLRSLNIDPAKIAGAKEAQRNRVVSGGTSYSDADVIRALVAFEDLDIASLSADQFVGKLLRIPLNPNDDPRIMAARELEDEGVSLLDVRKRIEGNKPKNAGEARAKLGAAANAIYDLRLQSTGNLIPDDVVEPLAERLQLPSGTRSRTDIIKALKDQGFKPNEAYQDLKHIHMTTIGDRPEDIADKMHDVMKPQLLGIAVDRIGSLNNGDQILSDIITWLDPAVTPNNATLRQDAIALFKNKGYSADQINAAFQDAQKTARRQGHRSITQADITQGLEKPKIKDDLEKAFTDNDWRDVAEIAFGRQDAATAPITDVIDGVIDSIAAEGMDGTTISALHPTRGKGVEFAQELEKGRGKFALESARMKDTDREDLSKLIGMSTPTQDTQSIADELRTVYGLDVKTIRKRAQEASKASPTKQASAKDMEARMKGELVTGLINKLIPNKTDRVKALTDMGIQVPDTSDAAVLKLLSDKLEDVPTKDLRAELEKTSRTSADLAKLVMRAAVHRNVEKAGVSLDDFADQLHSGMAHDIGSIVDELIMNKKVKAADLDSVKGTAEEMVGALEEPQTVAALEKVKKDEGYDDGDIAQFAEDLLPRSGITKISDLVEHALKNGYSAKEITDAFSESDEEQRKKIIDAAHIRIFMEKNMPKGIPVKVGNILFGSAVTDPSEIAIKLRTYFKKEEVGEILAEARKDTTPTPLEEKFAAQAIVELILVSKRPAGLVDKLAQSEYSLPANSSHEDIAKAVLGRHESLEEFYRKLRAVTP